MVIVSSRAGQLANRIIHFSNFIANAIEHDYRLLYPFFDEYREYFEKIEQNDFDGYKISSRLVQNKCLNTSLSNYLFFFHRLFRKVGLTKLPFLEFHSVLTHDEQDLAYSMENPAFVDLAKKNLLLTFGWSYRDEVNFKKHASFIRTVFTPLPVYQEETKRILAECKSKGEVVVGIHIRRGDYKAFNGGKWYFEDEVYLEKMKQMRALLKQHGKTCVFLVCSNEAVNVDYFSELDVVAEPKHFIVDLYALAKCDYLIGPPSTFTIWASFYGQVPLFKIERTDSPVILSNFKIHYKCLQTTESVLK
ncbi:alpha-1,2-fucosyltransferase [Cesiribacter sp. SM1]|uniref:alpha-1,2-fucosyltransferase n=1 Tax=Cesiribacter sp. SM1 TaxID=2861196 RepID=UPI001CD51514|nr:alpha-1,2-fucosyltransferase [Cesiribacter sp. SM1]